MRLDLSNAVAVCACALAMTLIPVSTGALDTPTAGPTSVEVRTPLCEVSPSKVFVIRSVETRPSAPSVALVAIFYDARDRVVKTVTGVLSPGHPVTFGLTRAELPTTEQLPTARAVVVARREGGFDQNQSLLDFKLVTSGGPDGCAGTCSICNRVGFSCAPPESTGPPSLMCEGAAVAFTTEP
jgi:hypothetical protein